MGWRAFSKTRGSTPRRRSICPSGRAIDGDGLTDFADPGCTGSDDVLETNAAVACDDGVDDDEDGALDLLDVGCNDPADLSEQSPFLPCDNGLDDDGDGFADLLDEGCAWTSDWLSESPPCSDGIDNDRDGLVDYQEDPRCYEMPSGLRERAGACGLGAELAALVPALYWLRSRRRRM